MATFYARYPATIAAATTTSTVQGPGTAGAQSGGVLTVQGDPAGTPVPISGTITATNPSVSATGAAVPASATFVGGSDGTNLRAVKVSATGVVSVDGSASTQPISGTVTATQGGTWTVQPGNTANTTPWLATVAQGGNSATVSAGGALKVDASASTQPVSGTVAVTQSTSPWVSNVSQFGGSNVATGTGTGGAGVPRVTVSSDSTLTSVGTVSTVTAVTTVATVTSVTAIANALPAGTNAIGSVIPAATAAAVWQAEGAIAFGTVTNVYATILTPSASTKIVMLRNNTNAAISVSFDAGTTTNFTLDAGDQVAIDYVANGLISATTAIQIKYAVGAPTSGSVRANACH